MKMKYFILTGIVFITGLVFTGCSDNRDDAKENVKQANQEMIDAQVQYEKDWQQFKSDAEAKIAVNQKTIDDFKAAMKSTSTKFKATYENTVLTLEQKNIEFKTKINDYQYKGKENWEEFKRGFNTDLGIVEKALKDIFEKKD